MLHVLELHPWWVKSKRLFDDDGDNWINLEE
jgi:hypothetical protein